MEYGRYGVPVPSQKNKRYVITIEDERVNYCYSFFDEALNFQPATINVLFFHNKFN